MLGTMRYRVHINRAEYFGALGAAIGGLGRLFRHPAHSRGASGWQLLVDCGIAFMVPLLLISLQQFTSYVELTPSSLEYRTVWRHHSILYGQMKRIVRVSRIAEIYGDGMKKLSFRLDKPDGFFIELRQYAPQALRGGDPQ
jgi:hypothetical protein